MRETREILFRGQTRRFGEKVKNMRGDPMPSNWVYGGVFHQNNRGGSFSVIYSYDPIEKHPVYADTVGQYTGVTDKNGTKIFEGDIVEFYFFDKTKRNGELITVKNTRTMVIEWYETSFYMRELFRNYHLDNEMCVITEIIYDYMGERKQGVYKSNTTYFLEVIGNIFDNPELLKKT